MNNFFLLQLLPTYEHKECFCAGFNKIQLMAKLIQAIICQGEASRTGRMDEDVFKPIVEAFMVPKIVTKAEEMNAKGDAVDEVIDDFQSLVDLFKGTT